MPKITLETGSILDITLLPFWEAWEISRVVINELKKLDVEDFKGIDFEHINVNDMLNLKTPLCSILASKELIEASKTCFKKCTYNGLRINDDTFENKEARQDFIIVCYHAIWENISPFFGSLASLFKTK
jgi:hypothetical protein